MNKSALALFILSASVSTTASSLTDIPDDFSELFEFKERPVTIKDLNGVGASTILLSVNYNTVKLPTQQSVAVVELEKYFKRNNIPPTLSERILTALKDGAKNSDVCLGSLEQCVVIPTDYEFYYDYENARLLLFVNGAQLDKPMQGVEFADALNKHTALVNHVDIYSSAYQNSSSSYSINNKSIQGLPYGHVTSDLTMSDSVNRFYELSYDLSFFGDKRVYAGRFDNGVSFNSTDVVSPTKFIKQTSFNFGSTNNLLLNNERSYERLFFFSPASGEVRVLRDGRIIIQQQISEGQGTLSYEQLPTGRYDIELEIIVAGKVISSEKKTIYNDAINIPHVGNGDYLFTIGQLNESRAFFVDSSGDQVVNDGASFSHSTSRFDDVGFASTLLSRRIADSLLVAAGGLVADGDAMAVLASQWYFLSGGSLNSSVSIYQPGAIAFDTRLATNFFSIQYEKLQHQEHGDTLAAYLMGKLDYQKLSGNIFYSFSNGLNSYYTYTRGEYSAESGYAPTDHSISTAGVGYDLPFNVRVDLAVDYDHVNKSRSAFITFQMPLGDTWQAKTSVNDSSIYGREYRGSVVRNNVIDRANTTSSIELASLYADNKNEVVNELYATASTQESMFRGSANVYANGDGNYGLSGSLSSSQVISRHGVSFSGERADAYAIIDSEIQDMARADGEPYGFVTLRKNSKLENKEFIYQHQQSMPISSYDMYNINIDTESVSLYNSGEQGFDGFTYPGSAVVIQPKLNQVVTFVSAFSDVFDTPVDDVLCKGFGCIDVSKVMDGVFRVTLVEGSDFELYAGSARCLIPREYEDAQLMNFGNNYCLPDAKPRSIVRVKNPHSLKDSELYYVGTFNDTNLVKDYISRLISLDGTVYQRQMGTDVALYLLMDNENSPTLSRAQQLVIESMQLYARENHSLNMISQPVAMRENSRSMQND